MPFALFIIGAALVTTGVRDTQDELFSLVQKDLSGDDNFIFWFVAIMFIGLLGYIPKVKPLSTAFLVLIITVLILSKGNPQNIGGGFFQQFITALKNTQTGAA